MNPKVVLMQDTCRARRLLHLLPLYLLISGDHRTQRAQLSTRQNTSLCRMCKRMRPVGKQCIEFLISRGWKFDRTQWDSFESSCILHFTESLWQQRYFRLYFVVRPHHVLCRIRRGSALCLYFVTHIPFLLSLGFKSKQNETERSMMLCEECLWEVWD